jgi:hypothetical protein
LGAKRDGEIYLRGSELNVKQGAPALTVDITQHYQRVATEQSVFRLFGEVGFSNLVSIKSGATSRNPNKNITWTVQRHAIKVQTPSR